MEHAFEMEMEPRHADVTNLGKDHSVMLQIQVNIRHDISKMPWNVEIFASVFSGIQKLFSSDNLGGKSKTIKNFCKPEVCLLDALILIIIA